MKNETLHIARNDLITELAFSGSDLSVIELLPTGFVKGRDGRSWTLNNPLDVIETTRRIQNGADLFIDYNHQSQYAQNNGRPAPAGGWIKELFVLNDKICARVDWTKTALTAIKSKEFRYISPVFRFDNSAEIRSIISAALTNSPNLDLKALNEKEILPMIDSKEQKFLTDISATLACEPTVEGILKAINEQKKPDLTKFVPIEKFTELVTRVALMEKTSLTEKAINAVNGAIKDGKLPPALKENALEIYTKLGETALNEFVKKMPSIKTDALTAGSPPPASSSATSLTEDEKATCQMLGITETTFKKGKNNAAG